MWPSLAYTISERDTLASYSSTPYLCVVFTRFLAVIDFNYANIQAEAQRHTDTAKNMERRRYF